MASLAQTFDTTRDEIIAAMEARIEKGDRTKLTKKELEVRGCVNADLHESTDYAFIFSSTELGEAAIATSIEKLTSIFARLQ